MAKYHLPAAAIAASLLLSAPAYAAPNVFWIFGFSAEYGHGAGGRAMVGTDTRLAMLAPPAPRLEAVPSPPVAGGATVRGFVPRLEYAALEDLVPVSRPARL